VRAYLKRTERKRERERERERREREHVCQQPGMLGMGVMANGIGFGERYSGIRSSEDCTMLLPFKMMTSIT
jgi:hypothetical protein